MRSSERAAAFRHAFSLCNVSGRLPPGECRVQTEEEPVKGLSFLAWRTTSISMEVPLGTPGAAMERDRRDGLAKPAP